MLKIGSESAAIDLSLHGSGGIPMRAGHVAGGLALFGLLLLPSELLSQSATTAGIAGVVRDTTGAVLPGVTVEAASPALIEKVRTAVADGELVTARVS